MRYLEFVLLAVAWPAVTYAAIFPTEPATAGILAISGMSAWGVLQALRG
jgi:hypothetical protein